MAGSRKPGVEGLGSDKPIDPGTLARTASPQPGPTGLQPELGTDRTKDTRTLAPESAAKAPAKAAPAPPAAPPGPAPAPAAPPPPAPAHPCVIQIKATLPGTNGVRKPATDKRAKNALTPSGSNSRSLTGNRPVILIRGCKPVELEAVTTPANLAVTWSVEANENTDAPPAITPTDGGKKAKLDTGVHGSFSVVATLGPCTVVWNVVFVWVKVDIKSSLIIKRNNRYADNGSGGGFTSFTSGSFPGRKYPWQAKVKVKVVGGGKSKRLGTSKVKLHLLQNGVADTLAGSYAPPPPVSTAQEMPRGGLPIRDSNDASDPWMDTPTKVSPNNTGFKREVWTADAPAGSFPTAHNNTLNALQSISGINGFRSAIASVSDDAPTALMAHADTTWQADFKGTVNAAGMYTPSAAKTTADARFKLISDATGGQDAGDAGFETFEPRFNGGTDTKWTP
jgi:hypothetical protein